MGHTAHILESLFPPSRGLEVYLDLESQLKLTVGCRMALKNVVSYVVDMVTCGAVGSRSCLLYMFLPAHTKETILCYNYRYFLCKCIKFELFSHTRTTVSVRIDFFACGCSACGSLDLWL